jgi:hypothetical protein
MDAKWETIRALNLRSVKEKLKDRKGFWWRVWHDADRLEAEYRQFLYLIATNPGKTVVPWTQDLDDFWHEHILDTEKYAQDCNAALGSFLHHNPHLPKGSSQHDKAFSETRQMYRAAFKETVDKRSRGNRTSCGPGCTTFMPVVFCASHHTSHGSGHHDAGHHDGGHGGHDGGRGGHGCGGHSGGGGHGCGGHGCGGHGCGGHGCGSGH